MARITLEEAYPGIAFRSRTRNWWARLTRVPPECVHLETEHSWMATLIPDTLYLRGKAHRLAESSRPEVSLCRRCLADVLEAELASYTGRVIAFEPDAASVSQCFFLAAADFEAAGLKPEVAGAIERRLAQLDGACGQCSAPATWLWCSQQEVASLDDIGSIAAAPGRRFCPAHGAATFCSALQAMNEANLFYINVPYGDAGAYVWI